MNRLVSLLFVLLAAGTIAACQGEPASPLSAETASLATSLDVMMTDTVGTTAYCWDPEYCGGQSGQGLYIDGWSMTSCTSGSIIDGDSDGVHDTCEYKLAERFSPEMIISPHDGAPTKEPYWMAHRKWICTTSCKYAIRIMYLLGYHMDSGSGYPNDFGDYIGHDWHYGDSEFVILQVSFNTSLGGNGLWVLENAFLSAHYESSFGDRSRWYSWSSFFFPIISRGNPRIWVAEDKHGNFATESACDQFFPNENCGWGIAERIPVYQTRNIGEAPPNHRLDCVVSEDRFTHPGTECFWTAPKFGGWSGWTGSEVSQGYWNPLADFMNNPN